VQSPFLPPGIASAQETAPRNDSGTRKIKNLPPTEINLWITLLLFFRDVGDDERKSAKRNTKRGHSAPGRFK